MSIPSPAHPAPFQVTRASHIVLAVNDLARSKDFYVNALGLVVSDEHDGALYLRGVEEACHHSLVIFETRSHPEVSCVGFRVYTDDDLDKAKDFFERQGLLAEWTERPHQSRTLRVRDAVGTPLEFCASMEVKPRLIVKFEDFIGGAPQRLDHFQVLTPNVQRAAEFYASMGFRMSEFVAVDGTDDLVFVFLQRKGNPHDIVFAHGSGPRLHHVAYTVSDAHSLIRLCDVAGNMGFGGRLEYGPGRHGPGHALFVYLRDLDGHRIEFFTTHYQIMDIENEPIRWDLSYLRKRPWGFPPRQSWYQEAMQFRDVAIEHTAIRSKPFSLEAFLANE